MIGRRLQRLWGRGAQVAAITPLAAARSHVGRVREINEDRFLVRSEQGLWAVADGMGGLAGGSEAAETAVAELAAVADHGAAITEAKIAAALQSANRRIRGEIGDGAARSGTTLVVAWLEGSRLTIFWVGDSRAYLIRGGTARCLTHDHSVVQDLLDAGEITPRQAGLHPYAHLVTRALGAAQTVEADKVTLDLVVGDRLLLCSDGVSRSLDTRQAARSTNDPIAVYADMLLNQALSRDGSDNTTLVAIELAKAGALATVDAKLATARAGQGQIGT